MKYKIIIQNQLKYFKIKNKIFYKDLNLCIKKNMINILETIFLKVKIKLIDKLLLIWLKK
jgi:hypothetical protein